jgi:hypothetical protein
MNRPGMDCKEFREKHALYVDLMCSAFEENEMREHARRCPKCSRHDTVVRRGLMLVRNLPVIEPSRDFQRRLDARLRATTPEVVMSRARLHPSFSAFAAVAAGVVLITYLATGLSTRVPEPVRMAPVVAFLPELEPAQVATPAFVATVPTGMSVWPAIMVASQAQMHFVAAELASER